MQTVKSEKEALQAPCGEPTSVQIAALQPVEGTWWKPWRAPRPSGIHPEGTVACGELTHK